MALPPEAEAMRPEMIQMLTAMIAEDAGLIVASLLAGGHDAEAREAVEEVRRANPGAETEEVLLDAAKNAGVDLP
jgi:methylmalonyl-CoA mutase cobalamin-binding subunit